MPRLAKSPDPAAALQMLGEQAAQRQEELEHFDELDSLSESDSGQQSDCPIVDKFFEENGNQAIMDMTNFTLNEILSIWNNVADHVRLNYNTGRGSKSPIHGKDLFFMTLTVLKHGGKWDMMAYLFGMKAPTFEKRVTGMVKILSSHAYGKFVTYFERRYSMTKLISEKKTFKNYKMCRYATDVTFMQSFRPGGSLEECKKYFSGKHKLYGYKAEVSVLPNGLAIGSSRHFPGSVSDIEIMRDMIGFHGDCLEKSEEEKAIVDIGHGDDLHGDSWGVLLDKGYVGIESEVRGIIPKKKPQGGVLSVADKKENEAKSADRIIVENFLEDKAHCGL